MTVQECLKTAFDNGLTDSLAELEKIRLRMKRGNGRIMLGAAGLCQLPLGYLLFAKADWYLHLIVIFVFALICAIIISKRNGQMALQFKQMAIPQLLDAVMPGFRYHAGCCIDESEFYASGLFISPDRYNGKDYVAGVYGSTDLRFSLVHAEERYETTTTETDSDGHTATRTEEEWRDIFKGLFFSADFNKHFHGRTRVRAGKAGILSGLFGGVVKLEDPHFSRYFTVTSTDQVEARYLLTPRMMERLLELRDKLGHVELSLVGSRVCIAAAGFPYNAFDPDISRPFTDPGQVSRTLGMLMLVIGIVEDLDLNTRIWTKR